jgi:hypothetical protein
MCSLDLDDNACLKTPPQMIHNDILGIGDSYPTHLISCRRRGDMKWGISWYQLCSGDQLMAHICAAYINHLRPWWEMVHIICPPSRPGIDMGKPLKRADIRACMGLLRRILRNSRRERTPPGHFHSERPIGNRRPLPFHDFRRRFALAIC